MTARVWTYLRARWCERAAERADRRAGDLRRRATRLSWRALGLRQRAEEFFRRLRGRV